VFTLIDDQGSQISAAAINVSGAGATTAGKITADITFPAGTLQPDERSVEQHGDAEDHPHLLGRQRPGEGEGEEDGDHDRAGGEDHPPGVGEPADHRLRASPVRSQCSFAEDSRKTV
jgi:hypothetical protein